VIRQWRRTSRRTRHGVHASVRIRSRGFGLLTGAAIVGALGLGLPGRAGFLTRLDAAPAVGAAVGAGAAPLGAASPRAASAAPTAAAIPDVPWLVQAPDGSWAYGHGGRATPRRLPSGETGIAVSPRWVAAVVPAPDGRSTVRFRASDTGRLVVEVAAPIWVSAGAWSSAGLVVTGYGDHTMTTDGGMVLVSPEAASATVLVAGGAFDARLGHPVARGDVAVSPSGRLVAANACGIRLCDAQVVDVVRGTVSEPIRAAEGFLRVLTDDAIVTTDGDSRWISARRVADGAEIWRRRDSVLLDPVATADGSVVAVTGSPRSGWGVAAIDAHGKVHDLGARRSGDGPWPRIWTALSGPSAVVVAGQPFAEWLGTGRSLSVNVIRLGGGRPASAAVKVRLPAASEWSR